VRQQQAQPETKTRRSPGTRAFILLLVTLFLLAGLIFFGIDLLYYLDLGQEAVAQWGAQLEVLIRSWGAWGVALSIGLMILHSFVPFPSEIIALATGMVYGPYWGTLITWTGAMLGAYLAFGLSRWLGRPFVHRILPARHHQAIDLWAQKEGGLALLLSRFVPVISFNLINYAAGLTCITWFTFTWATAIGILPLTFLMVMAGDGATSANWEPWALLLAATLAGWIAWRLRSYFRTVGRQAETASAKPPGSA
jgi:uncharacterized membrane protein YdjX (TVP38/TMEM64 family)